MHSKDYGFWEEGKGKRQETTFFLSLVTYMEEGYKTRKRKNVYLTSWQLHRNSIFLSIEAPSCQCWLRHSFQTSILEDMLLLILKWFWLTLAYILHLTEHSSILLPLFHVEKSPSHIVVYLACSDTSRQTFFYYYYFFYEEGNGSA